MTTPNKLLAILLSAPSTADSLASLAGVPFLVAKAMLQRHAKDGLVTARETNGLVLWSLTESGTAAANNLQPIPA